MHSKGWQMLYHTAIPRFMVFASSWGFQWGGGGYPHCTGGSFSAQLQTTSGRLLKRDPFSRFVAIPSEIEPLSGATLSSPKCGAGEGRRPVTVGLGLDMFTSKSGEVDDGAQEENPQQRDSPGLLGSDGSAGNGMFSIPVEMKNPTSRETQAEGEEFYGGNSRDLPRWAAARMGQSSPPKLLTLVIIHKDDRVLLGMKKRGFGKGFYNGFGGKVEKGETIDDAAARELQEESGVTALDMSKRGILTFHFDNDPIPWEVHVYHVSEIVGDPQETEEMAPKWFKVSEIPYETMWSDDILWYPEFLKGRNFKGNFYFENTTTLVAHSLHVNSAE